MGDSRPFLNQTAETASFAFREYFRPIVAAARFLRSSRTSPAPVECPPGGLAEHPPERPENLEQARAILRERLSRDRRHEILLLTQGMISALASLLALAISVMHTFELRLVVILAVILPASTFTVWVAIRLLRNREEITELKTIRWILKSVDEDTGADVARQILWGKPERKRSPRTDKAPN